MNVEGLRFADFAVEGPFVYYQKSWGMKNILIPIIYNAFYRNQNDVHWSFSLGMILSFVSSLRKLHTWKMSLHGFFKVFSVVFSLGCMQFLHVTSEIWSHVCKYILIGRAFPVYDTKWGTSIYRFAPCHFFLWLIDLHTKKIMFEGYCA